MRWRAILGLVLAGATGTVAGQGPFAGLERHEGVSTSRDGRTIYAELRAATHRMRVPGYAPVDDARAWRTTIEAHCRAADRSGGGAVAPGALMRFEDHPEAPSAATVGTVEYWIRKVTDTMVERWRGTAGVGAADDVPVTLARTRADYSIEEPGLVMEIPAGPVLDGLEQRGTFVLQAQGEGWRIRSTFEPKAEIARAVRMMRTHCAAR